MIEQRIQDKLNEGSHYLEQVKIVAELSIDEVISDFFKLRTAERLFEIVSQVMIDCCSQIVSLLNTETPTNYSHCFQILGRKGVVGEEEALTLSNIAKMRNIVTHGYGKIDVELLVGGLNALQSDFPKFKNSVLNWLDNR